ncbi:MAG TPA: hypothetical protein PKU93_03810 [Candidatus Pacearchaeota archaeon]|nr:hypothetical protein [Candidatus Pacearchaeota archaeon]
MNQISKALSIILLITILGFCAYQYFPTTSTYKEEVLVNNSSLQEETADWKVYVDNEHGFSIKYPAFIKNNQIIDYKEEGLKCFSYHYPIEDVVENPITYNTFCVGAHKNLSNMDLKDWVFENEICGIDHNSYENINLQGLKGSVIKGKGACPPGASGIVYKAYILNGSNIYSLRLTEERLAQRTLEDEQQQKKIFDLMLSTFNVRRVFSNPINGMKQKM